MSHAVLFEDIFEIRQINPDGKKFERGQKFYRYSNLLLYLVNRLHGRGTTYDVELILDVNAELFRVKSGNRMTVALARYVTFSLCYIL